MLRDDKDEWIGDGYQSSTVVLSVEKKTKKLVEMD